VIFRRGSNVFQSQVCAPSDGSSRFLFEQPQQQQEHHKASLVTPVYSSCSHVHVCVLPQQTCMWFLRCSQIRANHHLVTILTTGCLRPFLFERFVSCVNVRRSHRDRDRGISMPSRKPVLLLFRYFVLLCSCKACVYICELWLFSLHGDTSRSQKSTRLSRCVACLMLTTSLWFLLTFCFSSVCLDNCKHSACSLQGQCCHDQCLGGCAGPGNASSCVACRNLQHGNTCVDKCPPGYYVFRGWRCISFSFCQVGNNSKSSG